MTNPPIHITPHHLNLTPALHDFICKKIASISRFAGDILAADVVVRGKSGAAHHFSIGARLALPGRDIQGTAFDANLYTAMGKLRARLARLSRKRKTRFAKKTKRAGRLQTIYLATA